MVDWDRWVTIVQLLSDKHLDIMGLQEVKPTFPNIGVGTTLTFPEWQIYYQPHPFRTINGVVVLIGNTVGHFVLKDSNQGASLLTNPEGALLGLTLQFPNKPRLRVLNYFNDSIWSSNPSQFWHNSVFNRQLHDPLHEMHPDGSVQEGHTFGCHCLDAIFVSPLCWGHVNPRTCHIVAMLTFDHKLSL